MTFDEVIDAADASQREAFAIWIEKGRREERARVVAWIRSIESAEADGAEYAIVKLTRGLADAIERGEHER